MNRRLLGLANIKNYDEYTFNHSVNVAIYAIAIGQRVGIPKKYLSHLGMAGLFHDIGKVGIPKEILNKTGKLYARGIGDFAIPSDHRSGDRDEDEGVGGNFPPG